MGRRRAAALQPFQPPGPRQLAAGRRHAGNEHLSSLREPCLRLLTAETGLQYHRLDDAAGLAAALQAPALTQPVPVHADARGPLALLALGLLLARLWPGRGTLRQGFRWKRALPQWW